MNQIKQELVFNLKVIIKTIMMMRQNVINLKTMLITEIRKITCKTKLLYQNHKKEAIKIKIKKFLLKRKNK